MNSLGSQFGVQTRIFEVFFKRCIRAVLQPSASLYKRFIDWKGFWGPLSRRLVVLTVVWRTGTRSCWALHSVRTGVKQSLVLERRLDGDRSLVFMGMLCFLIASRGALGPARQHALLERPLGVRRSVSATAAARVLHQPLRCRLRNPGGFHLPPKIPDGEEAMRRAIELLGNRTQRRLQASGRQMLATLVGAYPPTKEVAQQWKYRLERLAKAEAARLREASETQQSGTNAPLSRRQARFQEIEQNFALPETDEQVQRAFSLLGHILARKTPPNPAERAELQGLINVVPEGMLTVRRAIRVLREHALERRRFERWPPFVPLRLEHVWEARVILRQIMIQRSAGARAAERLRLLLAGGYPRNQRVARSWWKRLGLVEHLYRKRSYRAMRLQFVESVRSERKARALQKSSRDDAPLP